jgi:hypothetical protein
MLTGGAASGILISAALLITEQAEKMSGDGKSTLVKALTATSAEETPRERWTRRFLSSLRVVAVVALLVCICIGVGMLWSAWRTGAWDDFFWNMPHLTLVLLTLARLPEILSGAR